MSAIRAQLAVIALSSAEQAQLMCLAPPAAFVTALGWLHPFLALLGNTILLRKLQSILLVDHAQMDILVIPMVRLLQDSVPPATIAQHLAKHPCLALLEPTTVSLDGIHVRIANLAWLAIIVLL